MIEDRIKELEQELEIRINDNADLYSKLCNALMQLEDANKIMKKYAETETDDWIDSRMPAESYLKKWEVK